MPPGQGLGLLLVAIVLALKLPMIKLRTDLINTP